MKRGGFRGGRSLARRKTDKPGRSDQNKAAVPTASKKGIETALAEFFVDTDGQSPIEGEAPDIHLGQIDFSSREAIHQYLSFRLADELYAVSILYIKEIIKPSLFTELPRTAAVILGIISLRGTIVPVVDLRVLLGLDDKVQTRKSRILIVSVEADDQIGLLVDEVKSVIRLRDEDLEPPPAVFGRAEAEHIKGVGWFDGEMYTLLELSSMVQLDRFVLTSKEGRTK